jgi:hypothetical protein
MRTYKQWMIDKLFSLRSYSFHCFFNLHKIVVQGRYIVIFTYVLTIYLNWIHPRHLSLSHLPWPLLRTILTSLIVLFAYTNTKYIHHIHPLCLPSCLPLVPTPGQQKFIFTILEDGKSKIKAPADSMSGEGCLLPNRPISASSYGGRDRRERAS